MPRRRRCPKGKRRRPDELIEEPAGSAGDSPDTAESAPEPARRRSRVRQRRIPLRKFTDDVDVAAHEGSSPVERLAASAVAITDPTTAAGAEVSVVSTIIAAALTALITPGPAAPSQA